MPAALPVASLPGAAILARSILNVHALGVIATRSLIARRIITPIGNSTTVFSIARGISTTRTPGRSLSIACLARPQLTSSPNPLLLLTCLPRHHHPLLFHHHQQSQHNPGLERTFASLRAIGRRVLKELEKGPKPRIKELSAEKKREIARKVDELVYGKERKDDNEDEELTAYRHHVDEMAWRSTGTSNAELVENLARNGLITKPEVKEAFLKVDRAHYAPSFPYDDSPQPIGHAATISAPHMHATAVEHLFPYVIPTAPDDSGSGGRPNPRILDVGSGSGYLTAVLAELAGPTGLVVGLEHISELRDLGERNMAKSARGRELLESGRVRFRVGDGRKGWTEPGEEGKKWDAIHVGAAAAEVHKDLLDQLNSPGRMFIPVDDDTGGWSQHVWCIDKDGNGEVSRKKLFGVRYVPLTDPPKRGREEL
ncbi:hypothetical protein VTJ04DRAFT_10864 [Mycothermus thermophilus]|uniref:uncharacterized protein n=1 Tax=Humicola insolens TaxID=85995 RepID=UPI0037431FBA